MGLLERFRESKFSKMIQKIFGKKHAKIGIYGPPNVGKTTLANRILRDWTGDIMGSVSEVPHETRRAKWKNNIRIDNGGSSLTMDLVDTPGIATKIDYKEFMNMYGMTKDDSRVRAKEATEGVIEAIRWLDDIDGVVLVMDATQDPFTQVNVTIIGNLEARNLPILIAANKIDAENASPATLKSAFPQHPVIPISALTGYNTENLYTMMVKEFGKKRHKTEEVKTMAKKDSGIAFNLISRQKLEHLSSSEKLNYILNEVKEGRILVLEHGLTPTEQTQLIEHTMKEINHDTFIGIEIGGYENEKVGFFQRVFGVAKKPRMTVIGPAHLLRMVHKDNDMIETTIIPGKGAS